MNKSSYGQFSQEWDDQTYLYEWVDPKIAMDVMLYCGIIHQYQLQYFSKEELLYNYPYQTWFIKRDVERYVAWCAMPWYKQLFYCVFPKLQ